MPQVLAVAPGTAEQFIALPDGCTAVEVIPGGTVTVSVRLGDGNDNLPLTNGATYCTPSNVDLSKTRRIGYTGASATTATIILWT